MSHTFSALHVLQVCDAMLIQFWNHSGAVHALDPYSIYERRPPLSSELHIFQPLAVVLDCGTVYVKLY